MREERKKPDAAGIGRQTGERDIAHRAGSLLSLTIPSFAANIYLPRPAFSGGLDLNTWSAWPPAYQQAVFVDHVTTVLLVRRIGNCGDLKRADFIAKVDYTDRSYDIVSGFARRNYSYWSIGFNRKPVYLSQMCYEPPDEIEPHVCSAVRHSVLLQLRYGGAQ